MVGLLLLVSYLDKLVLQLGLLLVTLSGIGWDTVVGGNATNGCLCVGPTELKTFREAKVDLYSWG